MSFGLLEPLTLSTLVTLATVFVHALPLNATVNLFRAEKKTGRLGVGFWIDMTTVARVILYALLAHLIEIGLWAVVFVFCGQFHQFAPAYYHSAVNFTTLGYGDMVMDPKWRVIGPLEAADGMLMFGISTAMIFAVIQGLIQARFVDLRG
jgi:hypothetical protein